VSLGPSQATPGTYNCILESTLIVPRNIVSIINDIRPVLRLSIESPPTEPAGLPTSSLATPHVVFSSSINNPAPLQRAVRFDLIRIVGSPLPPATRSRTAPHPPALASRTVRFVYTATINMIVDLLTKSLPLCLMARFTRMLLNLSSTPLVPLQAGSLSSA
jgi:hypothetical protein